MNYGSRPPDAPPPPPPVSSTVGASHLPDAWPVGNDTLGRKKKRDRQQKKQVAVMSGEEPGRPQQQQQSRFMKPAHGLVEVMPHRQRTDTVGALPDAKQDMTVKAMEAFQQAADTSRKDPASKAAAKWKTLGMAGVEMDMFDHEQQYRVSDPTETERTETAPATDGNEYAPIIIGTDDGDFALTRTSTFQTPIPPVPPASSLATSPATVTPASVPVAAAPTAPADIYCAVDFTSKKSKQEKDAEKARQLEKEERKEREAEKHAKQALARPESSSSFNTEKIVAEAWKVAKEAVKEEAVMQAVTLHTDEQLTVASLGRDENSQAVEDVEPPPPPPPPPHAEQATSGLESPMTEEELEAMDAAIEFERERDLQEKKRRVAEEVRKQELERHRREEENKLLEADQRAAERAAEITRRTGGGVKTKAKGFDQGIGVGGKKRHLAPDGANVKKMAARFEARSEIEATDRRRDDERRKKPIKTPSQKQLSEARRRESSLSGFDPDDENVTEDTQQDYNQVTSL